MMDAAMVTTMTPRVSGMGSLPIGVSEAMSLTPAKASSTARP